MPEKKRSGFRASMPYFDLGLTMALGIAVLAYLGHKLDQRWGTDPWLTLTGSVLGVVIGFINLFRTALPPKEKR